MLDEVRNEQNFLLRVITGDTIWVYCYDPESKQQWKKPILSMKKARQVRSNIKSMLIFLTVRALFIRNLFLHARPAQLRRQRRPYFAKGNSCGQQG
jgi:hypothetical protein